MELILNQGLRFVVLLGLNDESEQEVSGVAPAAIKWAFGLKTTEWTDDNRTQMNPADCYIISPFIFSDVNFVSSAQLFVQPDVICVFLLSLKVDLYC